MSKWDVSLYSAWYIQLEKDLKSFSGSLIQLCGLQNVKVSFSILTDVSISPAYSWNPNYATFASDLLVSLFIPSYWLAELLQNFWALVLLYTEQYAYGSLYSHMDSNSLRQNNLL